MENIKLKQIFGKKKLLIGMIHLAPLPGFEGHAGMEYVFERALADLKILEEAGFDGAMVENIDDPCYIGTPEYLKKAMKEAVSEVIKNSHIPIGMEIIYDMPATVQIACETGCDFVRLDVYADKVKTRWGIIPESHEEVNKTLKSAKYKPLVFADVHVKHARVLSGRTLSESIKLTLDYGADAIIITGVLTGKVPKMNDLELAVKEVAGKVPVIVGSGVNAANAERILSFADGAIIGSSLKKDGDLHNPVNIQKAKELVNIVKS
jgi:membrane complex biogenesis BtpA family protein